jgi:hypothetical protein
MGCFGDHERLGRESNRTVVCALIWERVICWAGCERVTAPHHQRNVPDQHRDAGDIACELRPPERADSLIRSVSSPKSVSFSVGGWRGRAYNRNWCPVGGRSELEKDYLVKYHGHYGISLSRETLEYWVSHDRTPLRPQFPLPGEFHARPRRSTLGGGNR